jgi:leader peptidase (prepilin peptidase) / N-methyltransferase
MTESSLYVVITAWVALAGAAVGSFLNVVIARVPAGESIVHPRSRCPRCGTPIAWYDNLPVVSWLLLRARCRSCRAPISWRYPLVELLGAGAALLALQRHGPSLAGLAEFAFVAALVALAFIDLDTWLLPNEITWPLIAVGLAAAWAGAAAAPSLRAAAWGAGLGFGAFATVSLVGSRLLKREALGFGDVWLLAGLGAWLGHVALLPVVLLASLQGSVVGIALVLLGRAQPGPGGAPAARADATPDAAAPDAAAEDAAPPVAAPAGTPPADAAPAGTDPEEDWVPPRHAVPFGPFLVAAALEWLYLADPLARVFPLFRPFV